MQLPLLYLGNGARAMKGANSHPVKSPGSNCLNVMYFNAQSLLPKMDKLRALVDTQRPHIVCILETWLSSEISDNELSLEGYQVLHLDRNRHGWGNYHVCS